MTSQGICKRCGGRFWETHPEARGEDLCDECEGRKPKTTSTLAETLERRAKVQNRITKALDHYDQATALSIVMAWSSIADLEEAAKTICKDEQP